MILLFESTNLCYTTKEKKEKTEIGMPRESGNLIQPFQDDL